MPSLIFYALYNLLIPMDCLFSLWVRINPSLSFTSAVSFFQSLVSWRVRIMTFRKKNKHWRPHDNNKLECLPLPRQGINLDMTIIHNKQGWLLWWWKCRRNNIRSQPRLNTANTFRTSYNFQNIILLEHLITYYL